MDDIAAELNIATQADLTEHRYEHQERIKKAVQLHRQPKNSANVRDIGFMKSSRNCLKLLREAMLHHQWQEAVGYFSSYIQLLEASTISELQSVASEITWRLGIEILHHLPNSSSEDFNALYQQLKNLGVMNFSKISLEHCFYLLLNGQMDEAKRQLSIAESWRYGKISSAQSLSKKLIRAYCGLLDYLIWREKRSSASENEESSSHEMQSYFRQASVTLKEIISQPGVWDPFVLSYINMLEYYNQEDGALQVLENYAYNKEFPSNPNAHVYLYQFLKRHGAPLDKLIGSLRILHSLVPNHELMLELCSVLLQTEENSKVEEALVVSMDLLEYASWKCDVKAWECLLNIMQTLKCMRCLKVVKTEWALRRTLWLPLHFRVYNGRKDLKENPKLLMVKRHCLCFTGENRGNYTQVTVEAQKKGLVEATKKFYVNKRLLRGKNVKRMCV